MRDTGALHFPLGAGAARLWCLLPAWTSWVTRGGCVSGTRLLFSCGPFISVLLPARRRGSRVPSLLPADPWQTPSLFWASVPSCVGSRRWAAAMSSGLELGRVRNTCNEFLLSPRLFFVSPFFILTEVSSSPFFCRAAPRQENVISVLGVVGSVSFSPLSFLSQSPPHLPVRCVSVPEYTSWALCTRPKAWSLTLCMS